MEWDQTRRRPCINLEECRIVTTVDPLHRVVEFPVYSPRGWSRRGPSAPPAPLTPFVVPEEFFDGHDDPRRDLPGFRGAFDDGETIEGSASPGDSFDSDETISVDFTLAKPKQTADPFLAEIENCYRRADAITQFCEKLLVEVRTLLQATKEMAVVSSALPLPKLPEGWAGDKDFKAIGTLSPAIQRNLEPVGPHFLAHARRKRHHRTFSEDERMQAQDNVKKVEDDDAGEISEPEDHRMLMRDAKDWKGQDHYEVLGITKYRWRATEDQIKRAHRKKVLKHHPDKRAAAGGTEDDSFFKCIQKATEILLDPVKRKQFDSVDEAADVPPPTAKQVKKGFYKAWGPVFAAESRFSRAQPVPQLGDEGSSKAHVEDFYNSWYNFESWRSFEYQDEDVPDDNENRDQKRHVEKKNNNARRKKKTEDTTRLRGLVDDCLAADERIKKFREAERAGKNRKRNEREAAEKRAREAAEQAKLEAEQATRAREEADKAGKAEGKKAKEAVKSAVKKNRRVLKGSAKDANYFVDGAAPAAQVDAVLNDVDLVAGKLDPDELAAFAAKLAGKTGAAVKPVWVEEVGRLVSAGTLKEGEAKTMA